MNYYFIVKKDIEWESGGWKVSTDPTFHKNRLYKASSDKLKIFLTGSGSNYFFCSDEYTPKDFMEFIELPDSKLLDLLGITPNE